jgi:excinuclease UvrABC ATPase subunit
MEIQLNVVQHGIDQCQLTGKEILEIESFFTPKIQQNCQKCRGKKKDVPALAHHCG